MSGLGSSKGTVGVSALVAGLFGLVAILSGWIGYQWMAPKRWPEGSFQSTVKKQQLVSTMRIKLQASAEAEKSAVLADTDEASIDFAQKALQDEAAVEEARKQIGALIQDGEDKREVDLFNQFSEAWEKLEEIDRELLPLAVLNTNLKALSLSFGPATEAIERMQTALDRIMDGSAASPHAVQIERLACRALTAALRIHTLESPHIAERLDERMAEIEKSMGTLNEEVVDSLNDLEKVADDSAKPSISASRAAYADFWRTNGEIIRLSRENSNVRSLVLSLGRKRKVTAQCEDLLNALQEAIQSTTFKATR